MPSGKKDNTNTEDAKKEPVAQRLYRSESDKVIAGVAGGLGQYFKIDSTIIRILFILLAIFGGSGLIIYFVLWLIIPTKSGRSGLTSDSIKSNIEDIKSTTKTFAHSISVPKDKENSKFWWAIMIIVIGFFFLLSNYGILAPLDLEKLWPLILILFGLAIILRK